VGPSAGSPWTQDTLEFRMAAMLAVLSGEATYENQAFDKLITESREENA